ncbi:MAG: right-handed parallel beta-helix repeat-containing protein, partial [Anaerolineae bacterium]
VVLDNHEGALWIGQGDDYFLYHRPSDDRFVLISWDHDSTFLFPNHGIWEPNWYASDIVERILNYPLFTRWYFQGIASITANEFSMAEMYPRIDALPNVVSGGDKSYFKWYVANRIPAVNGEIPNTTLSISTNGGTDFLTTQTEVTLEGECSPLRDIYVNGDPSKVQYPTATTWQYTSTLWTRDNVFAITDGLHTHTITAYWDFFHGGTLTESTTLLTSKLPYVITDDIVVPAGITLTIEPGVTLHFPADRMLRVEGGQLLAEGTEAQPILFTRQGDDYWGGIIFTQTQADNRIQHAEIEYTHGISVYGSRATIADSTLRHINGSAGIQAGPWGSERSALYLLRNEIVGIQGDAVRIAGSYSLIQGNEVHDVGYGALTPAAGIVLSNVVSSTAVLDNRIYDVAGNCLELTRSSVTVERNTVYGCGGTGISIGYPSSTTLVNNLVYTNTDGIAIKDGAAAHIANNTVADNQSSGIRLYEEHAGEGGGIVTVLNSILWGNETDLELDALSTVTVTYSNLYTHTATGTAVWPGEGNINADPLFRAPQNGNYRLLEESPCVDTGTPVGAPDEDIKGIYRPHGDGYDRGAHEFFEFFSCYLPLTLRSY